MAQIPEQVKICLRRLEDNGYRAYLVGGCVRDMILGRHPKDWDVTSGASPAQVKPLFPDCSVLETGAKYGTVTVICGGLAIEVTTFRGEGSYSDARHPDSVTFVDSLREDLSRRDFTINSIAMDRFGSIDDPFCGMDDIEKRIVRCVGDPMERFGEDPLRILRAVRFACSLGFAIDESTKEAIRSKAPLLRKISAERICAELRGIFAHPPEPFCGLGKSLVGGIFGCGADIRYLDALSHSDAAFPVRMVLLLFCAQEEDKERLLRSLKPDREMAKAVMFLINAVKSADRIVSDADARVFLALNGIENAKNALSLFSAIGRKDIADRLQKALLSEAPCGLRDLAVGGKEIGALGARGREVGDALRFLLIESAKNPSLNTKDQLIGTAARYLGAKTGR